LNESETENEQPPRGISKDSKSKKKNIMYSGGTKEELST
jgi:hypothetical protein